MKNLNRASIKPKKKVKSSIWNFLFKKQGEKKKKENKTFTLLLIYDFFKSKFVKTTKISKKKKKKGEKENIQPLKSKTRILPKLLQIYSYFYEKIG